MGYERLGPSEARGSVSTTNTAPAPNLPLSGKPETNRSNKKKFIISSIVFAVGLILAAVIFAGIRSQLKLGQHAPALARKPSQAISKACETTRYPELCVDSLLNFPGSLAASSAKDLIHVTVNMTLHHFSQALYSSSSFSYLNMPPRVRSAYDACLELLDDSVDALSRALSSVVTGGGQAKPQDVMTWLSAALTNQDTCAEGFDGGDGGVKEQMSAALKNLSELVSNCLAIFVAHGDGDGEDFVGVPIENRRRRLLVEERKRDEKFPRWMKRRREREILEMPVSQIQADIVVSKDGKGTCKTISEAIKKAPEHSTRRTIIYVKAGR